MVMARDVMGEASTMKLCYKLRTGNHYSTVTTRDTIDLEPKIRMAEQILVY